MTIVNASEPKRLELRIEVPVEDMARLGQLEEVPSGATASAGGPKKRTSIWAAIHPCGCSRSMRERTVGALIVFVNNRRTAERLAGAINDLAGEATVAPSAHLAAHGWRRSAREIWSKNC